MAASDSDSAEAVAKAAAKKDKKEKKKLEKRKTREAGDKDKKRSDTEGVHKDKKDKKKDRQKQDKLARVLDAHLQADAAAATAAETTRSGVGGPAVTAAAAADLPSGTLVPFAFPLADDKTHKKAYKLIKKGAKLKSIHRGVKECEKAIKKLPLRKPETQHAVPALLIVAGDISPMEVIEHFPVHAEEHNVPYLFVRSRADLGVAACTKRATSVVLLKPEGKTANGAGAKKAGKRGNDEMETDGDGDGKAGGDKDAKLVDPAEYHAAWTDLVKLAQKEWIVQVEPFIKGLRTLKSAL